MPKPVFASEISNQFTISLYVNPTTSIVSKALLGKAEEVRLFTDASGLPGCQIKNTTWQTAAAGTAALSLNTWSHVTCTYDKAVLRLYVNGVQVGTSNLTVAVDDTASNFLVGEDGSSDALYTNFIGTVDQFQVYNYARTQKQIVSDMGGGSPPTGSGRSGGPTGYWKMDQGVDNTCSGGTNDVCNSGSGGSSLDGANSGFASPATPTSGWTQSGKYGKALIFDGSDDYINIGDPSGGSLDFGTGDFSLSFWYLRNSNAATNLRVISKGGNSDSEAGWSIFGSDTSLTFIVGAGSTRVSTSATNLTTDVWYHGVTTRSGANIKLYINGVLVNSNSSAPTGSVSNDRNFTIGALFTPSLYFTGKIDEVKVYPYALTADEVKVDYNRGSSQVLGTLSDNSSYQTGAANQEYCVPGDTTSCAAPVGRWDFENNVLDTSGNAYNGTWNGTGTPRYKPGKAGKAGNFNGSDDYVSAGANPITGSSAFTLQAWMKMNSHASYGLGVMIGNATSGQSAWIGWSNTAQVGTSNSIGGGFYGRNYGSGITDNNWHFVTLTFSGGTNGTALLYIDGVQKTTDTQTPSLASTIVMMGKANTGIAYWYKGFVDQVRIYNYVRTPAQIAWDYNKGAPVGHWKFDECQGDRINDSSGNSNTGTITIGASGEDTLGTCTTSSTAWGSGATGKRNASLSFDGTDDYVSYNAPSSLSITGPVTQSLWVKFNGMSSTGILIGANQQYNLQVSRDSTGDLAIVDGAGHGCATAGGVVTTDQWYHIVGVFSGTSGSTVTTNNCSIYINGVPQTVTVISTPWSPAVSLTNFNISNWNNTAGSTYKVNGLMDDVKVFNYALTATQVKLLYNNGAVNFSPSTGTP